MKEVRKTPPKKPQTGAVDHIITALDRLSTVLRSQAWEKHPSTGLTPGQFKILTLLTKAEQRGMRVSTLAQEMGVSAPTISEAVRTLIARGLVAKREVPEDARAVALLLTEEGRSTLKTAASLPDAMASAVGELSQSEQAGLLLTLSTIIGRLQELGQISVNRMCVSCTFFRPDVHQDPEAPHHCVLTNQAFADGQLRLDCAEHQLVEPKQLSKVLKHLRERHA